MKLVIGLGNPGLKYAHNRHNVGFMVIDELLRRCLATTTRKFKGEMTRVELERASAVLLKPMTYMNLSGESVGACARYYDVDPEHAIVIHDELDLPFGEVRIKRGGGHAGHNGLRSIFQHYAPGDFPRVRIGIGRPQHGSPSDWVLSDFGPEERIELDDVIQVAATATSAIVREGVTAAMNANNRRRRKVPADDDA